MLNNVQLEKLVSLFLAGHSYDYENFQASRSTISISNIPGSTIEYDRMSLCIYEHDLSEDDYSSFHSMLQKQYFLLFSREDQKARSEYVTLFRYFKANPQFELYKIEKAVRPDFILSNANVKIGIEVTEFTTTDDSILTAISRENFGKGKTALEIKQSAEKKHGKKALKYKYDNIGTTVGIRSGVYNTASKWDIYADEVVKKYEKYRSNFGSFNNFIVLCDAYWTVGIDCQSDADQVISLAKGKCQDMTGFSVHILYLTSSDELSTAQYDL